MKHRPMGREFVRVLTVLFLLLAGGAGVWLYVGHLSSEARLREEQEKNRVLREVISRLSAERRVAEMRVVEQSTVNGVKVSRVRFVEYARGQGTTPGPALPAREFTVRGDHLHLDAMVIKFDGELVGKADPLRGATIALFTRVYGDATPPTEGELFDQPGDVPAVYRTAGTGVAPGVSRYELQLWQNFWQLAYDETARKNQGVRAMMGQGLWEPLKPGVVYTVTLESNGGLNLTRAPVAELYRATTD